MQWYNSTTNELSSTPPWGASYLHPDIQADIYSDWQQVSDDFVPSTVPLQPVTPFIDPVMATLAEAVAALFEAVQSLKGGES